MQPSIVCLGSPMIDVSVKVHQDFLIDNKLQADCAYDANEMQALLNRVAVDDNEHEMTIGGSVTNTARIIKWIGKGTIDVTYLGAIGSDEYGCRIRDALTHEGIEMLFAIKNEEKTARCTILLYNDKRTLFTELGASKMYTIEDLFTGIPSACDRLKQTEFVYFSSFFLRVSKECVQYLLSSDLKQTKIIFNLGAEFVLKENLEIVSEIIGKATIIIGNLRELLALCQLLNVDQMQSDTRNASAEMSNETCVMNFYVDWMTRKKNKLLIVTDGENPAMLLTGASLKKFQVRRTHVKDANGAGDAFAGGFIAKYLALRFLRNAQKVCETPRTATASASACTGSSHTATVADAAVDGNEDVQDKDDRERNQNEELIDQVHEQRRDSDDEIEAVDLDECMNCALWAASEIVQNTGCNFDRNKSFT